MFLEFRDAVVLDYRLRLWWGSLVVLSAALSWRVTAALKAIWKSGEDTSYTARSGIYAAAYTYVCAFRSLWPRQDVEKVCLFDNPVMSGAVLGRSLATVAEICFVLMIRLWLSEMYKLYYLQFARNAGTLANPIYRSKAELFSTTEGPQCLAQRELLEIRGAAKKGSWRAILARAAQIPIHWMGFLIYIAECLSWIGVLSRKEIWNGIENSIWGIVFFGVLVALADLLLLASETVPRGKLVLLARATTQRKMTKPQWIDECVDLSTPHMANAKRTSQGFFLACIVFCTFIATVDVPMYFRNFASETNVNAEIEANGFAFSLYHGFFESLQCRHVKQHFEDWQPHLTWMWCYFTGCVWGCQRLQATAPVKPLPCVDNKID